MDTVRLSEKLAMISDYYAPKIVGYFNDCKIEVVKASGDFVWHTHEDTDDFFLVLSGELTIQLRDRDVLLREGDLYIVPRGVEHCPTTSGEAHVLLIEPRGTPNTGDAGAPAAVEQEI